ncbi:alpha/beta fold hydrolase [Nocardia rhizosphaerihabitans]|uniref:alpha/beta fold hydrolase n=1 Tax=Nocardia rhizosphaerihabitans TaxID=1691570 RepID=UPI00166B9479
MASLTIRWTNRYTGGPGAPLVLLHAAFLGSAMFDAQLFGPRRGHRVIAPDARGHGEPANATMPFRHTDDLAALLRHIDAGPAVPVGVSMGAMRRSSWRPTTGSSRSSFASSADPGTGPAYWSSAAMRSTRRAVASSSSM